MKSTALTILIGLSLTLGLTVTSRAEGQQTASLRGCGQCIKTQTAKQPSAAPFVTGHTGLLKARVEAVATGELRPVTVTNAHGSSITLFERVK